ncbi:GDYXXLXY domain-containing protein [Rhizobium sp. 18055]|uniref:GDYXXLXY domain-containing protein n=1 Tax=Rhizobium sp. 18055 TaxID=2681403 RepID=UPI001358C07F|nr:GDYXXLXY domain-containing protein [Rhizobium sp. 18055]
MSIFSFKGYSKRRCVTAAVTVALLQTAVLGYIVQSRASILQNGTQVLLKTAPVDPRDFLRGDYVVLNYDISSVPVVSISGGVPKEAAERSLWVRLKPGEGGFWQIAESSFEMLPQAEGSVVMHSQPFYSYGSTYQADTIHVEYGIERYYVPEGTGRALEQARQDGEVSIAASVGANGTPQIKSLLVDGKPAYEEPLY